MLLRLARERPFLFGMGYSCFKTSFCDLMVQKVVEKRETIDWKRNAVFGSFGLFYLGGVQYTLYVPIFSRLFPNASTFAAKSLSEKVKDLPGIRNLVSQVFIDQFVHHPLLYFPVFYTLKDIVVSEKPDPVAALNLYRKNMQEDLVALWKLWVPTTFLNFAFMPMWARIPWVATTSLVWTCILSAMRGGQDMPSAEVLGPSIDGKAMELFERSVVGPAPPLDPTRGHVLVTLTGPDRTGLVASLSRAVYDAGGSIWTSKMIRLGNECAIVLHVECKPADVAGLFTALSSDTTSKRGWAEGCELHLREVGTPKSLPGESVFTADVRLTGEDRPGLTMKLASILGEYGLNIEHLQTEQHVGAPGSPRLFSLHGVATSPTKPNMQRLTKKVAELEQELNVLCSIALKEKH